MRPTRVAGAPPMPRSGSQCWCWSLPWVAAAAVLTTGRDYLDTDAAFGRHSAAGAAATGEPWGVVPVVDSAPGGRRLTGWPPRLLPRWPIPTWAD